MHELTSHELALMERMTPEFRALIPELNEGERTSMEKNVTLENLDLILSWIGSRKEIERLLFWDRADPYDDPARRGFRAVDRVSEALYEKAEATLRELRSEAVDSQLRSDLTLYSQFNEGLLFTGLAGAVRCDEKGEPDDRGAFFKGVKLRCIGSMEDQINAITLFPLEGGRFVVHFGERIGDRDQGIEVYSGDSFSILQLDKLITKDLAPLAFTAELRDVEGRKVSVDPKAVRKAARKGDDTGVPGELFLYASKEVDGVAEGLSAAKALCRAFYDRFGLETECYKIGKKYGNFFIVRNDNFGGFLPDTPVKQRGLVLFTATLVCRRCRRELESFRDLARAWPDLTFGLVNLVSPQFEFYERVFGDMGGGDPKNFRDHAAGSTPFTIIYAPDDKGILKFMEYYGTDKAEAAPSKEECMALLQRHFGECRERRAA